MDVSVGIAGAGRAAAAVETALGDVGIDPERIDAADVDSVAYPVVIGVVGDGVFERAHGVAADWLALELGGIGGCPLPGVDAAASILGEGGCFRCLRQRVRANRGRQHEANGADREETAAVRARTEGLAGALAGHRLLAWIDGEAAPGDVLEVPYVRRRLVPVPGCDCDSEIDRELRRAHASVGL
jgi:ribosomal protein S12 methylthiotransferase accessory factor